MIERWLDGWTRGWRDHDVDTIAQLYTDEAVFVSHPFREPESPREYLEKVFADEEAADFEFETPIVDGDRAAVQWWATTRLRSGGEERLRGVTVLRFAADGRCCEHRDYWAAG